MIYKNTIITLMTIFSLMSIGWGQEVEWTQTYGGGGHDIGYSVQQTSDGGYIVTMEPQNHLEMIIMILVN